jgi:hypothetical protein
MQGVLADFTSKETWNFCELHILFNLPSPYRFGYKFPVGFSGEKDSLDLCW